MRRRKLYILITFVITLCSQPSCNSVAGTQSDPPPGISSESLAATIVQADMFFTQREDILKLREAINLLAKARDPYRRNFEVEWKFAKFNYFLGTRTDDEKEAEASFGKGRDAGKIASGLEPGKPDGYFWYGTNLGELSRMSPITVGLKSIDEIKDAMNKVIEIQPDYQNTSAYDALAQVELGTRFDGGSVAKAVELLEKGLQTERGNMNLRLRLAEAYLVAKKASDARRQLDQLLQMTPDPEYLPEDRDCLEKARHLRRTRF